MMVGCLTDNYATLSKLHVPVGNMQEMVFYVNVTYYYLISQPRNVRHMADLLYYHLPEADHTYMFEK